MLSDEEKKEYIEHEILDRLYCLEENDFDKNKVDDGYIKAVLNACKEAKNLIEKQSKEIEELKASHITTNNKATNTEKAKIFDVIENSIDTYIEKSKPYWEQIMTKDEMTIEEALTIIDDMYQDRYKIMSQKTEKETLVDLSKMDYIKFTNLEWASVRALREVQSLSKEIEEMKKQIDLDNECEVALNSKVMDLEKEIEELTLDLEEMTKSNNHKKENWVHKNILNSYVSKDKIKAKIEELDEEIKVKKEIARKPMDRVSGRLLTDNIVELEKAKKVLQSLLEKE